MQRTWTSMVEGALNGEADAIGMLRGFAEYFDEHIGEVVGLADGTVLNPLAFGPEKCAEDTRLFDLMQNIYEPEEYEVVDGRIELNEAGQRHAESLWRDIQHGLATAPATR